jgi:hypothetical protein
MYRAKAARVNPQILVQFANSASETVAHFLTAVLRKARAARVFEGQEQAAGERGFSKVRLSTCQAQEMQNQMRFARAHFLDPLRKSFRSPPGLASTFVQNIAPDILPRCLLSNPSPLVPISVICAPGLDPRIPLFLPTIGLNDHEFAPGFSVIRLLASPCEMRPGNIRVSGARISVGRYRFLQDIDD